MIGFKKAKKSLGQNFLVDQNIIKKIIKIGNIDKNKTVLEIGPGYGSLTKNILAENPNLFIGVEKDKSLAFQIKKKFKNYNKIEIINDDIINYIENKNFTENIIVFGNLPYNISTQILAKLALLKKWPPWYSKLIFMFQKEVADRIVAKEKTKKFGRLSILCGWRFEVTKHFDVSKNCFSPKPKINSTVLSFIPKKDKIFDIKNPKCLEKITRVLFSNRRKMINKSFVKLFGKNTHVEKDLNLNLNQRPEELSKEMFYKIALKYDELSN